jgi:galactokinase
MDQAASVIPEGGSALYITFHPQLAAEPVPIPASANPDFNPVFVIANSLVISDKAVSAKTQYNLRVVETLVAARVLAHHLGVEVGTKEKVTLREVLDRWIGHSDASGVDPPVLKDGLGRILRELDVLKAKDTTDGEVGLTMKEMISISGLSNEQFNELYLSWVDGQHIPTKSAMCPGSSIPLVVEATHFQLYKRAKHVYSEALRVLQFRDICLKDAGDIQSAEPLKEIGAQMNDSQESCASQFECSCLELDDLVSLARAAGAFGSRLTGELQTIHQRVHTPIFSLLNSARYRCRVGRLFNFRGG